jgi:hypothetical protein
LELTKETLSLLLPELLITHFNLTNSLVEKEVVHLHFEEKKDTPEEEKERILTAHGFHQEITVQDFPLRGKSVFLHIKRRRWLDKSTKEVVQRDWNLVAKGSRMTNDFADFLKAISIY